MLITSKVLNTRDKKLQFSISYVEFIFNGMVALSAGSIMPFIRDARGFDYAFAGLLFSIFSCGNLFSNFMSGVVELLIGKKKSTLLFNSFYALSFLLMLVGRSNISLAIAFFMVGLARGAFTYFNNSTINTLAPGEAWAINGLHAMFSIGAFFFPLFVIGITSANPDNWIYACYFMIFMGIVSWVLNLIMPVDEVQSVKVKNKENQFGFFKEPLFWLCGGTLFFYLCAEQGVIGWMITYFKDSGLMSSTLSQVMASVLWITILAGRLTVAYFSTRVKKSRIYLMMGIGFVAFFILLLVSRSTVPIVIGIIGFGFSMAGIYPTTVSFCGDIIKKYSMSWSFMLTMGGIGSIVMPYIIGRIAEASGIVYGMSSIIVVVVIDCILMISLVKYISKKTSN